jgi:hypothetical protein
MGINRMTRSEGWAERYLGGSPEAERQIFLRLATRIMKVQARNRDAASKGGVPHRIVAGFQAKPTFAVDDAELRFLDLPAELSSGYARAGATYPAMVRFSNAEGKLQSDHEKDLRGLAIRVLVSPDEQHDLLMTSYPVAHARDAEQFVAFATATAGGTLSRVFGLIGLPFVIGAGPVRPGAAQHPGRPQADLQRRHRELLEPHADPLG